MVRWYRSGLVTRVSYRFDCGTAGTGQNMVTMRLKPASSDASGLEVFEPARYVSASVTTPIAEFLDVFMPLERPKQRVMWLHFVAGTNGLQPRFSLLPVVRKVHRCEGNMMLADHRFEPGAPVVVRGDDVH